MSRNAPTIKPVAGVKHPKPSKAPLFVGIEVDSETYKQLVRAAGSPKSVASALRKILLSGVKHPQSL